MFSGRKPLRIRRNAHSKELFIVQTELWTRTKLGIRDQQTEKSNKAINSALRANNINQAVAPRARRRLLAPAARPLRAHAAKPWLN